MNSWKFNARARNLVEIAIVKYFSIDFFYKSIKKLNL